jgi:hypothetical protein
LNTLGKFLARAAVAALGLTVFYSAASAEPRGVNIMVAGEDFDPDTIPRGNVIFNRVLDAISEQLIRRGFRVFDEGANLPDLPQDGVRRELKELLWRAGKAAAPIDVIVVFQIYGRASKVERVRDAYEPVIRIRARMIRVRGGEYLGSYEYGRDIEFPYIPDSCVNGNPPKQCLLQTFGDDAMLLAPAVGDALAVRLAGFLRPDSGSGVVLPDLTPPPHVERRPPCEGLDGTAFVVKARNFDPSGPSGLNRLEEYLTSFACYQRHRIVFSVPGESHYWYETRANSANLMQNLRIMIESMELQGTVSFTGGNVIIVENNPPPGLRPPR